jgi:3-hydroxyisobutyrate dehydrogenase-like beta-hydroxyacid dehydrogenase
MDKKVGFIGLGTMGKPMAMNIHKAGYNLHVFNRSSEKTKPFQDRDIPVHDTPKELAENSEVIILMVTGPEAVKKVVLAENGIVEGLQPGTIVINMSTIAHETTMGAADIIESAEGKFLDVPVSGTKKPAEDGTLVILAGGEEQLIQEVTPLLNTMGKQIIHCGDVGQATNMKLMINLLLGSMMQGFSEALTFGEKAGLDFDKMMDTIDAGGLSSLFYNAKGNLIKEGDYTKNFAAELLHKDLSLVLDEAGKHGVSLPQTAAAREVLNSAKAFGFGDEDMAAVYKTMKKLANLSG